MKPAVTAKDWQEVQLRGANWLEEYVGDTPEAKHYVAALNLYGQTFGFTREDVGLLRDSAVHLTSCASFDEFNPSTRECNCDGYERSRNLADRIEALLPPE